MDRPLAAFLLEKDAYDIVFSEGELARLNELLRFPFPPVFTNQDMKGVARPEDVEVLITGWGMPDLGKPLMSAFPNLKLIAHAAGSVKSFTTDDMWEKGVRVVSAAKANAIPVAEFALSQIIFSLKHGWQRVREIERESLHRKEDGTMPGAYRSTVGILSYGLIGRLVRRLLRVLEVSVIVYDPFLDESSCEGEDVELMSLEEVFARADVVTCHTPQLPETIGLIRGEHFESMKAGASFINTARGALVNEEEMIRVLRQRRDLTAILDVTEPEPPVAGSPLYELANVVLTPHIAGSLAGECRRMGELIVSEIERYVNGEALECERKAPELPYIA